MDTISVNSFVCPKKKMNKLLRRSTARLLYDLREVKRNPLPHITVEPLPNDLFHWHGNIRGPAQTPFEGGVFHFSLQFGESYPSTGPSITFVHSLTAHPFVRGQTYICLQGMLENSTSWTPAFSVSSILRQLQSFFIDGLTAGIEFSTGHSVTFTQRQTSQWKEVFEAADKNGEGTLSPSEIREVFLEIGERRPSPEELAIYYHMFHLQPDQPVEFSTFLDILARKREFRKVVEATNKFSCSHSKCNHGPQTISPAFNNVEPEAFIRSEATVPSIHEDETRCFWTKKTFQDPDNASLGLGISFQRNPRNGQLHKVICSRDLVSLNAFRKINIQNFPGLSTTFTHWMPLYLNEEHGERAMHLLSRSLGIICSGSHRDFRPAMGLEVITRIIGGVVQNVAVGSPVDASRALRIYTQMHHMLLMFTKRYPEVAVEVQKRIQAFVEDPSSRVKDKIANISDFLGLLGLLPACEEILSQKEETKGEPVFNIQAILSATVDEINTRSVMWIVKKHPELEKVEPNEKVDAQRIPNSFDASKAGFTLLLFHYHLYKFVACPGASTDQVINSYNQRMGYPTLDQEDSVLQEFERLQDLPTYEEVYLRLGLPTLSEEEQLAELRKAVLESAKNYYHCKRQITVKSANEYLQEKLKQFVSLDELVDEQATKAWQEKNEKKGYILKDDEELYQKLCLDRFGAAELPEVDTLLSEIPHPWQHLYLKLNMEDLLCKFNENPDFKRFYREVDLSAATLRSVEFTVVPVTNVKSNFFYLTALLSNLWNLEKFTVRKGEIFLDLKGCKALCKGLKNNPNSLRVLDLHYCHITPERMKILEDGLLSSEKLLSLNVQGNPISDDGANSIAAVLRVHKEIAYLNVGRCAIGNRGAKILADAFYHNNSLKYIRLSQNTFSTEGLCAIFRNLAYSDTIEQLELTRNDGYCDANVATELARLFEVNTSLRYCNFYMTRINNFFSNQTLHALSQNRSLTELDVGCTQFEASKINDLGWAVARNRNLKVLRIEKSQLGPKALTNFSEAIFDSEEEINKRAKAKLVRDLTSQEIEEELRPRGNSLEIVNLSKHTSVVDTPRDVIALERLVAMSKDLVELDLSKCSLGVLAGDALGRGLKNHPSLLRLLLAGNTLEEHGIKKMCKGLHENTVLQELDISHNSIGGRGASAVAQVLAGGNNKLQKLNLFGNFIGIEGARFIAEALSKNTTLHEIDLGLNRMRPKGVFAIAQAMKQNRTLKVLRLKQNFINDKTAMELSDVLCQQSGSLEKLCIAGNKVKDAVLNSIVNSLKALEKPITVDIATLLSVTRPDRLRRTVYCTPLPQDVTVNSLKKIFYDGGCGAILNVSILRHSTRKDFATASYAFVEFAEEDSVQLALDIGSEGKAKTGKHHFSVIQAQGDSN